jgi:hypothetical protein
MVALTAPETTAPAPAVSGDATVIDLAGGPVRALNQALHDALDGQAWTLWDLSCRVRL